MKSNLFISKSGERAISLFRAYPLEILGTGVPASLFMFFLTFSLILPRQIQAQGLQTPIAGLTAQTDSTASTDIHQPLIAESSYADLVERVAPAVVTVRSEKKTEAQKGNLPPNDDLLRQFFGGQIPQAKKNPQVERGLGAGVIIDPNGIILTNNHVVDGATTVKVDLIDKRTFTAKIIGTDPASDLALLKIDAEGLPILKLGDSDKVRVGDVVLAIGNPLGLRQTVTSGIISAKSRQTGLSDGSFEDFLQTDAAINQGNSGGALVNLTGDLIGINSQILSPSGGSIGIGFAIPSNMAKSVVAQLEKDGKVHRGMLGVGIQDVTADLAENFGLKNIRGVIVNSVTVASPAAKAGLKQGDVIVSLDGKAIADGNELRNKVSQTSPGTAVTIGYLRNGSEESAKATLAEFQAKADKAMDLEKPAEPAQGKLGLSLQPLTPQIAQQLGVDVNINGLVVGSVQLGGPGDEAGIEQGDIITEVNRQTVKSVGDVQTALAKTKGKSVLLLVNRGGTTLFVTAQI